MLQRFRPWVLGLLLLLAACSNSTTQTEVTVEVNDSAYTPNTVEVVVGQGARLTLRNTGLGEHQFAIKEIPVMTRGNAGGNMPGHNMTEMDGDMDEPLQLHIVTAAGATNSLDFTPTKTGEYEFRCTVPGHTETGTLIVKGSR